MTEHRREYEQKSPDDLIDIRDSCTDLQEPKVFCDASIALQDSQMQKKMMRWSVIAGVAALRLLYLLHRIFCIGFVPILPFPIRTHPRIITDSEIATAISGIIRSMISTPTPTNRQAQVQRQCSKPTNKIRMFDHEA